MQQVKKRANFRFFEPEISRGVHKNLPFFFFCANYLIFFPLVIGIGLGSDIVDSSPDFSKRTGSGYLSGYSSPGSPLLKPVGGGL